MKHSRRRLLHLATGAAVLPALQRVAQAQSYPARPVSLIVGFSPGGAADIVARLMAQQLSLRLGQQFIVENKPGAGTNIATELVVRAAADGYTLLLATTANAINATLYKNLHFNFLIQTEPVSRIIFAPLVMVVNPTFPARTVPEFIAYAKAHPGEINLASSGIGTPGHLAGELFKMMAGITMVHVPYNGGAPALTDLMGGRAQVFFSVLPDSIAYIRDGKLRALAVTTSTRSEALPDVPTLGDFLPGYEASAWDGIVAPAGTPTAIIVKLNKEINAILADQEVGKRLRDLGSQPSPSAMLPFSFKAFIVNETLKWKKVIESANIKQG
jgi:tripartite-type tricarboxylate transporter receptor subunit TctC